MEQLQPRTAALGDGRDDLGPVADPLRIAELDIVRRGGAEDQWLNERDALVLEGLLPLQQRRQGLALAVGQEQRILSRC